MNRRAARASGFTLLEVLVGFTILAIVLTALIQAFSQGLRASAVAEERATAVILARSKLAEVGILIPLEETELIGEFDGGLGWRLAIEPASDADADLGNESGPRIYEVALTVLRGEQLLLEVWTLRLGPRPQ